jgi:hypothetical protein
MNRRYHNTFRKIIAASAVAAVASVAVLWSWNTLAPLFGGPAFEFRHAVAFLIALVALRIGLGHGLEHRRHDVEPKARS